MEKSQQKPPLLRKAIQRDLRIYLFSSGDSGNIVRCLETVIRLSPQVLPQLVTSSREGVLVLQNRMGVGGTVSPKHHRTAHTLCTGHRHATPVGGPCSLVQVD
jgi:hypothetical protein